MLLLAPCISGHHVWQLFQSMVGDALVLDSEETCCQCHSAFWQLCRNARRAGQPPGRLHKSALAVTLSYLALVQNHNPYILQLQDATDDMFIPRIRLRWRLMKELSSDFMSLVVQDAYKLQMNQPIFLFFSVLVGSRNLNLFSRCNGLKAWHMRQPNNKSGCNLLWSSMVLPHCRASARSQGSPGLVTCCLIESYTCINPVPVQERGGYRGSRGPVVL